MPKGSVAVVSHDAGGAEILSSWLRQNSISYQAVLAGPATRIFQSKLKNVRITSLRKAIENSSWVLTGASWQSDIETDAIRLAKAMDRTVITFLDHWVNYRLRFQKEGKLFLPHQIWVGDSYALEIAKKELGDVPIFLHENPYFSEIKSEISEMAKIRTSDANGFLFISENISSHARTWHANPKIWGYDEYDAITYFLKHIDQAVKKVKITIRLHPSDSRNKYQAILENYGHLYISVSDQEKLSRDISTHKYIVGCNSTAMVLALLVGKRVIASIPPKGRPCVLPHIGIQKLADCSFDCEPGNGF